MIQPGDPFPEVAVQTIDAKGIQRTDTRALFGTGRTVLFAVPGAFTPTCSEKHLPGYIQRFDEFRERGVKLACMSANDPFVMQAWMQSQGAPEDMIVVADGNVELARALGLELDASTYGMGTRSKRFAMLIEDGAVKQVHVEAPGELRVSTAEYMLEHLDD